MATPQDARKIAALLPGVAAIEHFGRPAFRTARRIFAVVRPDGLWLYLPAERKEFLFGADAQTFVKTMWGASPELLVQLSRVDKKELSALLAEAWQAAQPKQAKAKPAKKRVSSRASRR